MQTATQTTTATPTCGKAILLPCPHCGNEEANIDVSLSTLDDAEADTFKCSECENTFSINFVRNYLRKWARVLTWLAAAPDLDAE